MARQSITATPDPLRVREDRAIFRALRIVEQRAAERGPLLSNGDEAGRYFRLRLAGEVREHFEVAFLDAHHRLIACERLFSGALDGAEVHPRIIAQRALTLNAGAVILAHNHPSGCAKPSVADRTVTHRIKQALDLVDVRLLDHVVVSAHGHASMSAGRML